MENEVRLNVLVDMALKNERVFNGASVGIQQRMSHLKSCFDETKGVCWRKFNEIKHGLSIRMEMFIGWEPPIPSKIKINMDGETKGNSGFAGARCVLRDSQEGWIVGAIRNLGITTSVNAKHWRIL